MSKVTVSLEKIGSDIVCEVAAQMRALELRRAMFPYLTTQSGRKRLQDLHTGRGVGRVNLPSALKRFVKTHFSDFVFRDADGDEHHFQKRIADDVSLTMDFERVHHFGMGKTYTIWLGVRRRQDSWPRLRHNLTEFFDRVPMDWCYATNDELEACLKESQALLTSALPVFERACRRALDNDPIAASSAALMRGNLDFHQSARIARNAVAPVYPDFARIYSASYRTTVSAGDVPATTLLLPDLDSAWRIHFADDAAGRVIGVYVPTSGALRFALGDMLFVRDGDVNRQGRPRQYEDELLAMPTSIDAFGLQSQSGPGVWERFLSTEQLLQIANESGGSDFTARSGNHILRIILWDDIARPRPTWRIEYRAIDGRRGQIIELDAIDGHVVQVGD